MPVKTTCRTQKDKNRALSVVWDGMLDIKRNYGQR